MAEGDYAVYLDKLKEYSAKYQVQAHVFVLMTNHVHLLLTPSPEKGDSQLMQSLVLYYALYINKTYRRTGTLWEGRYKSTLVDSVRYFLTVSRYIELNPVRANIVLHPAQYSWSSYRGNALGGVIRFLTCHTCYLSLGRDAQARRSAYRALFDEIIPSHTLVEIRDVTNKAWVLGDDRFKQQVTIQSGRRAEPLPSGGDRRSKTFKRSTLD
ncbi:predicted transposase [Paraglaciecola polaris LMG 21857]|uniref:Predicted transposase n=2 Tax=Paraglaciecola polaris TaxID=222814 RepID=K7A736_9ALTE|nr:predicted transposase [Paraglaciecola polaris LMG 21857]|tara:strand:- start:2047 stop:2679 length:633 start_codon:yes stop_codon:yes gene_type:complete